VESKVKMTLVGIFSYSRIALKTVSRFTSDLCNKNLFYNQGHDFDENILIDARATQNG